MLRCWNWELYGVYKDWYDFDWLVFFLVVKEEFYRNLKFVVYIDFVGDYWVKVVFDYFICKILGKIDSVFKRWNVMMVLVFVCR